MWTFYWDPSFWKTPTSQWTASHFHFDDRWWWWMGLLWKRRMLVGQISDSRDHKSGTIWGFLSIHCFGAPVLHLAGRTWLSFDSLEVREAKLTSNRTKFNMSILQSTNTYSSIMCTIYVWYNGKSMKYIISTRFQWGDNQLFPLWIRLSQDPGLVSLLSSGCDALPRRVGSLRGVISAWNKSLTVVGVTQADRYDTSISWIFIFSYNGTSMSKG